MLVACQPHEMVMMTEHQFTSTASKRNGLTKELIGGDLAKISSDDMPLSKRKFAVCHSPRRLANLLPPNTR